MYAQYVMFYLHRCEQYSGWVGERVQSLLPTRLLTPIHVQHTILQTQLSYCG